jgi:hypothetical protein
MPFDTKSEVTTLTLDKVARSFGVDRATLYRLRAESE